MIHSLFIINNTGDVFMEKHWKSVIHKSICDYFFEAQTKASSSIAGSPEDISPIIATPHHYLINIYRNQLYYVAVVTTEVPPLFVIEFLHRVVDVFEDYFQGCSESILKEHYLLDEMLDNGFPLAMEANILKELIKPPNFLRTITDTITGKTTGVSATLPTGQLSNVPWRRTGVKYTNNEAYFDVIEEVDAIIDKSGSTVTAEIQGYTEKILSFVPPDGNFRLLSYHIGSNNMVAIPVYLKHNIFYREGSAGRFDVTVSQKTTMGKTVENLVLECPFPKAVLNVTLTPNQGKYTFDPVTKVMTWEVGRLETTRSPNIKGTINLQTGSPLQFTISTLAISGLKVNRLDMYGENIHIL
ncbi:AP3M1-like protein [Mya arenaria]|uniref:AP3M1-like protein n=1 Tax=Mya arenaria TaxID=6604 RepID=A0ABY7DU13_MYAAR|nr:AP3M1-like protein [Mya arenaria]